MKLVQKQFLRGSREFEVLDDMVYVQIKSFMKEEKLSVGLSTLDPEPVIADKELVFNNRNHGRAALSLLLDIPDAKTFNSFVNSLKHKIIGELTGVMPSESENNGSPQTLGWNVYDEPPAFDNEADEKEKASFKPVYPEGVEQDISMLKTYMNPAEIQAMLDALEELKAEPNNELVFEKVLKAFDELGFYQGAVLTYAPYLKVLLSRHGCF